MSQDHKTDQQILNEIKQAEAKITIDARYVHYKGADKTYKIRGLATLESTNELCVIYKAEYGQQLTFIRPLSVWLETVEWQGQRLPRFKKI